MARPVAVATLLLIMVATGVLGIAPEIHRAAAAGDLARIATILSMSPNLVNTRDSEGRTPLHLAARSLRSDAMRLLLNFGADVSIPDRNGVQALHSVAFRGDVDLVWLLAESGADVDARSGDGSAPIHYAVRGGHPNVVISLVNLGAEIELGDGMGNTALLLAASSGFTDLVDALLDLGADPKARNGRGISALSAAQRQGHLDIVAALVRAGGVRPKARARTRGARPYLGQSSPGTAVKVFGPEIISTELHQISAAFSPDGDEIYFTLVAPGFDSSVMLLKRTRSGWSGPEIATFSGEHRDVDPFISPDDTRVLFSSRRPVITTSTRKKDWDLWSALREDGAWSEPQHLGVTVNSAGDEFHPTLTEDGTLYFSSNRAGGRGGSDIYRSRYAGGRFLTPDNLGAPVNSRSWDCDPFISGDEGFVLFVSDRPGGQGGSDIYVSFRVFEDDWTQPENLGVGVNTRSSESAPVVTPDGRFLVFSSRRSGVSDIYWTSAGVIEKLRQQAVNGARSSRR
jgi:ankyrin repeat protein